jgi:ferredoxin-NADP reductase
MSSSHKLIFIKKEKISSDAWSFYFDKSKDEFDFNPGEYLKMHLNIKDPDERGSSRYFTIASSPLDEEIVITTRVIRSSFKKKLLNLKEGEVVEIFSPMGNFVIDRIDKRTKIFLAGGIGMTTFYSMIKFAHQTKDKRKIILIASFSNSADFIYKTELENISKENPNIKIIYLTSRIDEENIKDNVGEVFDKCFYIVGSEKMVENTKNILLNMNIPQKNIKLEDFSGY